VNSERTDGRLVQVNAEQLEETCYRYLKIGGGVFLVGLALMLTTVMFWLGAPLAAIGAAIMAGTMVWLLRLNKTAGIAVACPNCDKEYNVLPGSHNFVCDDCQHVIPAPRAA
jgi:hypothetical protein